MGDVLAGGAVAVIAGVIGAFLSRRNARQLAIEAQRKQAANELHDELVEIRLLAQVIRTPKGELRDRLDQAETRWNRARLRLLGRIGSEKITERLAVISNVLLYGYASLPTWVSDGAGGRIQDPPRDLVMNVAEIIERCFQDALGCLEAYLDDEPLPPRSFLTQDEFYACETEPEPADVIADVRRQLKEYPPLNRAHHSEFQL